MKDKSSLKMWVQEGCGAERELFRTRGYKMTHDIADADIVVFIGGADVDPIFYNEEPLPGTGFHPATDARDLQIYRRSADKIKVGICRGGQFLNVMNGGRLWQHVDNHGRSHKLRDVFTGKEYMVSSTHHQQFRPATGAVIVAEARETTFKQAWRQDWRIKNDGSDMDKYFKRDFEVVYYPTTRSLCFQPHPEYMHPKETAEYFHEVMDRLLEGKLDTNKR